MQWHDIVNTIIALVGAVTGCLALWLQRRDSAIRVRVTLEVRVDRMYSWIETWNYGRVPTKIDLGGYEVVHPAGIMRASSLFAVIEGSYRNELAPGERARLFADARKLGFELKKAGLIGQIGLRARVTDTLGNRFTSKRIKMDVGALTVRPANSSVQPTPKEGRG